MHIIHSPPYAHKEPWFFRKNGRRDVKSLNQPRCISSILKFDVEAFIPREKGCLLDCLDWVQNRGASIDACFV